MATSVLAAFFALGWRNNCVSFEIASIPVRAVHPEENARKINSSVTGSSTPWWIASTSVTVGNVPVTSL